MFDALLFSQAALRDMWAYTEHIDLEICGIGRVTKDQAGIPYVSETIILPQEVTAATVAFEANAYEEFLDSRPEAEREEWGFNWHSHVNMACNPSGTDTTNYASWRQMFYSFVPFIINKRGEYYAATMKSDPVITTNTIEHIWLQEWKGIYHETTQALSGKSQQTNMAEMFEFIDFLRGVGAEEIDSNTKREALLKFCKASGLTFNKNTQAKFIKTMWEKTMDTPWITEEREAEIKAEIEEKVKRRQPVYTGHNVNTNPYPYHNDYYGDAYGNKKNYPNRNGNNNVGGNANYNGLAGNRTKPVPEDRGEIFYSKQYSSYIDKLGNPYTCDPVSGFFYCNTSGDAFTGEGKPITSAPVYGGIYEDEYDPYDDYNNLYGAGASFLPANYNNGYSSLQQQQQLLNWDEVEDEEDFTQIKVPPPRPTTLEMNNFEYLYDDINHTLLWDDITERNWVIFEYSDPASKQPTFHYSFKDTASDAEKDWFTKKMFEEAFALYRQEKGLPLITGFVPNKHLDDDDGDPTNAKVIYGWRQNEWITLDELIDIVDALNATYNAKLDRYIILDDQSRVTTRLTFKEIAETVAFQEIG